MKKTEIYVPIANKKEAKRAKAVLKAMGENIADNYFNGDESGLWYYYESRNPFWTCFILKDNHEVVEGKIEITLKQLIELLALQSIGDSVVNQAKESLQKIAVRVDNENEFNALMSYFELSGRKLNNGGKPTDFSFKGFDIIFVDIKDLSFMYDDEETEGYKIIQFAEFAKEHNIKLPLLVSEDRVDLYEGDEFFMVNRLTLSMVNNAFGRGLEVHFVNKNTFLDKDEKAFSSRETAEKWIETQKPKTLHHRFSPNLSIDVVRNNVTITDISGTINLCSAHIFKINSMMEELNNG